MADSFEEIENRLDHITKEMDYLNHHQVVIGFSVMKIACF